MKMDVPIARVLISPNIMPAESPLSAGLLLVVVGAATGGVLEAVSREVSVAVMLDTTTVIPMLSDTAVAKFACRLEVMAAENASADG